MASRRGGEAIEIAVLVAGVDAAFVVGTKRDPGPLDIARDGVKELNLEAGRGFDAVNRRGLVLADGLTGIGVAFLGRGFGFRLGGSGLGRGLLARCWRDDALRIARDLVLLEGEQGGFGQLLEHDILNLNDHGRAFMHLEGEQAFERTALHVVIDEVDGDLAVNLVDEMVALRDDDVLVPLGDVDLDGRMFSGEPLIALLVDNDALAVLDEDTAATFFVDHGVVRRRRMDVALVATDDPLADLGEFFAAILDT